MRQALESYHTTRYRRARGCDLSLASLSSRPILCNSTLARSLPLCLPLNDFVPACSLSCPHNRRCTVVIVLIMSSSIAIPTRKGAAARPPEPPEYGSYGSFRSQAESVASSPSTSGKSSLRRPSLMCT